MALDLTCDGVALGVERRTDSPGEQVTGNGVAFIAAGGIYPGGDGTAAAVLDKALDEAVVLGEGASSLDVAEVARRLVDLSGRELDGGHTWLVGDVGPGEGLVRTLRVG